MLNLQLTTTKLTVGEVERHRDFISASKLSQMDAIDLVQARSFFFFEIGCGFDFTGNGINKSSQCKEYVVVNQSVKALGGYTRPRGIFVDLDVSYDTLNKFRADEMRL